MIDKWWEKIPEKPADSNSQYYLPWWFYPRVVSHMRGDLVQWAGAFNNVYNVYEPLHSTYCQFWQSSSYFQPSEIDGLLALSNEFATLFNGECEYINLVQQSPTLRFKSPESLPMLKQEHRRLCDAAVAIIDAHVFLSAREIVQRSPLREEIWLYMEKHEGLSKQRALKVWQNILMNKEPGWKVKS